MWNTIIIEPFTNLMLLAYYWLGGNFLVSIIALTVLVRAALIPLTHIQTQNTKKMQEIQPQLKEIQEKYRDSPEKMQQEMTRIGYNPLSMLGGCLLTFIQFPIWIGLYQSILRAVPSVPLEMLNLYNAHYSFLFPDFDQVIPIASRFLWMDLGQPERIFVEWLPIPLAVLPFLVLATTWLQQQMMTPPPDPNANDTQAQMMRSMSITMPLMLFVFAFQFAAGLSVYFITSNIIGAAQFAYTNRERLIWKQSPIPGLKLPALRPMEAPTPTKGGKPAANSAAANKKKVPVDEQLPEHSRRKKAMQGGKPDSETGTNPKPQVRARARKRN